MSKGNENLLESYIYICTTRALLNHTGRGFAPAEPQNPVSEANREVSTIFFFTTRHRNSLSTIRSVRLGPVPKIFVEKCNLFEGYWINEK